MHCCNFEEFTFRTCIGYYLRLLSAKTELRVQFLDVFDVAVCVKFMSAVELLISEVCIFITSTDEMLC